MTDIVLVTMIGIYTVHDFLDAYFDDYLIAGQIRSRYPGSENFATQTTRHYCKKLEMLGINKLSELSQLSR